MAEEGSLAYLAQLLRVIGGLAYVNDNVITTLCSTTSLISGKGGDGAAGYYVSTSTSRRGGAGGNGGCGGGAGAGVIDFDAGSSTTVVRAGGFGYFSDGGSTEGASAKGGNLSGQKRDNSQTISAFYNSGTYKCKGYFVGGSKNIGFLTNVTPAEQRSFLALGGTGGFLGGKGADYSANKGYTRRWRL